MLILEEQPAHHMSEPFSVKAVRIYAIDFAVQYFMRNTTSALNICLSSKRKHTHTSSYTENL